jgi:hypothetical protein
MDALHRCHFCTGAACFPVHALESYHKWKKCVYSGCHCVRKEEEELLSEIRAHLEQNLLPPDESDANRDDPATTACPAASAGEPTTAEAPPPTLESIARLCLRRIQATSRRCWRVGSLTLEEIGAITARVSRDRLRETAPERGTLFERFRPIHLRIRELISCGAAADLDRYLDHLRFTEAVLANWDFHNSRSWSISFPCSASSGPLQLALLWGKFDHAVVLLEYHYPSHQGAIDGTGACCGPPGLFHSTTVHGPVLAARLRQLLLWYFGEQYGLVQGCTPGRILYEKEAGLVEGVKGRWPETVLQLLYAQDRLSAVLWRLVLDYALPIPSFPIPADSP